MNPQDLKSIHCTKRRSRNFQTVGSNQQSYPAVMPMTRNNG
ncbi:hypothetical protein LEMLEM_LOCUS3389 [Lemmus lemmus]